MLFFDGGLAQLVERLLCKQDVSGSSPLTSTCCTVEVTKAKISIGKRKLAKKGIIVIVMKKTV
jgi:hypothetical protein